MEPRTSFEGCSWAGEGLVFAHPKLAGQRWLGAGLSGGDEGSVPPWGGKIAAMAPRHREMSAWQGIND